MSDLEGVLAEGVKMSYNAALARVRCELTRLTCLASEAPPADLLGRAKAKLEAVKAAGEIAFYSMYETRLTEAWQALRNAEGESPDRKITITLGAGSAALPGIKVERIVHDKAVATLTVEAPKDLVATWRWESFKLMVTRRLREAGIREPINNAQLYGAFNKIKIGEKVSGLQIGTSAMAAGNNAAAKAFSVVANKQRLEIGVVIRNVKEIANKANRDAMLLLINQAVKQLSVDGIEYRIMKKEFLAALQSAFDGPEGVGLELPLVLLAAVGQGRVAAPTDYPGAGRIEFEVTKDKMEVAIRGFMMSYYDDPTVPVNVDWVQNELKRCHISIAMADDVMKGLAEAIRKQADLNGILAGRGITGVPGKGPFLFAAYKDASGRVGKDMETASINMRDLQQRETVKAGQLVAEIRYKQPPIHGKTIYGDEVLAPVLDELTVKVGEGINQKDGGKFYATMDGMVILEEEAVSLTKVLVHQGDVNLRSGNIHFDGPVEITGSIDHGSAVETTGDLIVRGSVRGGRVRAQGNITIESGVTTGPQGYIQARGNITAEFIENSNILAGADLIVTKALLNTQAFVGGGITVKDAKAGVIAGGRLFCRESITTANLGFKRGAITFLDVGVDWRAARAVDIKKRRLEKIQKKAQDDRQSLRELVQKKQAQMTPRHKEMKEELQERLTRMRTIIEKLETLITKCTTEVTYSSSVRILVKETLAANVNLTLGGQPIAVLNDVAAVAIVPKRRRGSFIVAIEEVLAQEQAEKNEEKEATKKAG